MVVVAGVARRPPEVQPRLRAVRAPQEQRLPAPSGVRPPTSSAAAARRARSAHSCGVSGPGDSASAASTAGSASVPSFSSGPVGRRGRPGPPPPPGRPRPPGPPPPPGRPPPPPPSPRERRRARRAAPARRPGGRDRGCAREPADTPPGCRRRARRRYPAARPPARRTISSIAASRPIRPLIACSRWAAVGAIVIRSSMPSAIDDVGCSSDTGAASRRASAAIEAAAVTDDPEAVLGALGSCAQSGGQIGEPRVQQLLHSLGGDRHRSGQRQAGVIERQRHRRDLVTAGRDRPILGPDHERAVAGGPQLHRELAVQMGERVMGGAMRLRQALEAERVLEVARRAAALGERAAGQQRDQVRARRARRRDTRGRGRSPDAARRRCRGSPRRRVRPRARARTARAGRGRARGSRCRPSTRWSSAARGPRAGRARAARRPAPRSCAASIVRPVSASPTSAIWLRSACPTEPIVCSCGERPAFSAAHSASATRGRTPA